MLDEKKTKKQKNAQNLDWSWAFRFLYVGFYLFLKRFSINRLSYQPKCFATTALL